MNGRSVKRRKKKFSVRQEPEPEVKALPPAPVEEAVLVPERPLLEQLLPTANFTTEDLALWRKEKANVMDALQVMAVTDLQNDPQLRRQILARQGYNALETIDRIGRLERGQSTSNISIATFDGEIESQRQRIAALEELREKLRTQEQPKSESNPGGIGQTT